MAIFILIMETSTIYQLTWCWLCVIYWLSHHWWTGGYSIFLRKNIIFGVMQISCVGDRIQILQLIMGSWKTRCIILDLNRRNGNIGDHNTHLQYLRITACTTDRSFPYINHSLHLGNCNKLLRDITPMAIFWNMKITVSVSIHLLSWAVVI